MILSGRDIQWYIEQKKLVITPIKEEQFRQNGVDLILKQVSDPTYEIIEEGITTKLVKSTFYLGVTNEYFEFPDDLMAFVELRSTWARKGIMLPPTIVDAGFKGTLTLEIVSFITQPVPIGERFAHLIFAKMTGPSIPYDGKYQGQRDITPAIRDK
jgi:dCTP deaminase